MNGNIAAFSSDDKRKAAMNKYAGEEITFDALFK
jgi:hypothetical protein